MYKKVMIWLWRIWSLIYFVLLAYVVFFASRRPSPSWHVPEPELRLTPFSTKWSLYLHGHNVSSIYLDVLGNIVMFIPFTLFLYIVFGVRKHLVTLLAAFFLSLSIETIQYFTGVGFADIDDLIFNTSGALLGILVIEGVKMCGTDLSVTDKC